MRSSFSRVLRAVPATAAVSGSVFASVWLLAINSGHAQVPRAAAGASSTVVHATLPRTHRAAVQRALSTKTGAGTPAIVTARARSAPSSTRVGTSPKGVVRQVAPSSGANAPAPHGSSAPTPPTSTPKPVSPASVPSPPPPPSTDPGGSVSFGVAVAPSTRTSSSPTPTGNKRTRSTQRAAAVRTQPSRLSGTKKAEPGQPHKQAAANQTDGKQTNGKQSATKQTDGKQTAAGQPDPKQTASKQADTGKNQAGEPDSAQSDAGKGKSKNKH
jgi:hypothetical protein